MPEEGIRDPGVGDMGRLSAAPHACWELNSGSLEEQEVLLTTELSPQPLEPSLVMYFGR